MSALSPNEIWLLKQLTCLPQEYHTHVFLKELLTFENSEIGEWFSETLSSQCEKGWLLENKEADSCKMHRIIADVVSKKHPVLPEEISNLALVLKDLGDYFQAKELLEKAVVSNEKNFGPEHPTTAVSYSNLALMLLDLGDYEKAFGLSEKSVKVLTSTLPAGHPSIIQATDIYNSIKESIGSGDAS